MDPVYKIEHDHGEVALTADGKFLVGWGDHMLTQRDGEVMVPARLVHQLLDIAHARGKDARSAEILKLIGGK